MISIDRSLVGGLLCGLLVCLAVPEALVPCARADEDDVELRGRERSNLEERVEIVIQEEVEQHDRAEQGRRNLQRTGRESGGRLQRRTREREVYSQLQARRAELAKRDDDESMERERMERERRERDRRERDERAEMEHHAIERASREMEIRRQEMELRVAEMELDRRLEQFSSKSDETGLDAIKMTGAYMEPVEAAQFFASVVDKVDSPHLKKQVRLKLAELYFQSDQTDKATEQIRMLLAPRPSGGH